MESWESIQKTLDYIEENLSKKMEINNLATVASLSPFYYQRLFSRLVGKPVKEYIKLRRLANAADLLVNDNRRIIDIGMTVGFENHETFTRSFKEAYSLTPETFRKQPRPVTHFSKPDLSMKYQLVDEDVPLVADGIILEVSRKNLSDSRFFAGISTDAPFPNNPGVDYLAELWHNFHSKKNTIDNLKQGGNEIGVGAPSEKEGHIKYFVGAEVTDTNHQNEFINWVIPVGNYVVCSFEAENFHLLTTNALDKAVQYMYSTWIPRKKITTEPFMAELYFDTNEEAVYMEIWMKIS
ncbi:AraC family transcriptional regulator [Clostridium brassicae]|uniref:Helix-turn-helix domain-containing protein n=1 Tax=Clostridium brassicae TaxID=2999072 RepID=A0ABT4D849_9CLOT|nr:helix-turn-helix domain-containing protein [Clostridium brassicae]MCY6957214.1 helix-turn-helix domain-containing protein [Clostridium brassicae]